MATGEDLHRMRWTAVLRSKSFDLPRDWRATFNDMHFTEKLNEPEGIAVSRETVRRSEVCSCG